MSQKKLQQFLDRYRKNKGVVKIDSVQEAPSRNERVSSFNFGMDLQQRNYHRTQEICRDLACKDTQDEYPRSHLHSTINCASHQFCRQSTIPTFNDKFSKRAIAGIPNEMHVQTWQTKDAQNQDSIAQDSQQKQRMRLGGSDSPLRVIPEGRKVVMSEEVLDSWLAAHYGITPDNVPTKQPQGVPKHLFERFKKLRHQTNGPYGHQIGHKFVKQQEKKVDGADKGKMLNKLVKQQGKNQEQKGQSQTIVDNTPSFKYKPYPDNFNMITYPVYMQVNSITDNAIAAKCAEKLLQSETPKGFSKAVLSKSITSIQQNIKSIQLDRALLEQHISLNSTPPVGSSYLMRSKSVISRSIDEVSTRLAQCGLDHKGHTPSELVRCKTNQFKQRFGPNATYYTQPQKNIRNRLLSKNLKFLNYREIEDSQSKLNNFEGQIVSKVVNEDLVKKKLPISNINNQSGFGPNQSMTSIFQKSKKQVDIKQFSNRFKNSNQNSQKKVLILQNRSFNNLSKSNQEINLTQKLQRKGEQNQFNTSLIRNSTNIFRKDPSVQALDQQTPIKQESGVPSFTNNKKFQISTKMLQKFSKFSKSRQVNYLSSSRSNNLNLNTFSVHPNSRGSLQSRRNEANNTRSIDHQTKQNCNTEVGSTQSGTFMNNQSLRSSTQQIKNRLRLSQMVLKRTDLLRDTQQQTTLALASTHQQEKINQQTLDPAIPGIPPALFASKDSSQSSLHNSTLVLKVKSRALVKGRYRSMGLSVGQRVRNENKRAQEYCQQQALQQQLASKYCVPTHEVQVPQFALLSQGGCLIEGKENGGSLWGTKPQIHQSLQHVQRKKSIPLVQASDSKINQQPKLKNFKANFGQNLKQSGIKQTENQTQQNTTSWRSLNKNLVEQGNAIDEVSIQRQIIYELSEFQQENSLFKLGDPNNMDMSTITNEQQSQQDEIDFSIKLIQFDLAQNTFHKDFKDYRFWLKIAQKKFQEGNNDDLAIDFLRNGIREIPTNPQLLYNYACANEKIGNFQIANRFFGFATQLKKNWSDALFGEAITHIKVQNYKQAEICIKNAIENYDEKNALEKLEVMKYFQAMVFKKLKNYEMAKNNYEILQPIFGDNEAKAILHFMIGLMLLPLRQSRRDKFNYIENLLSLIMHFKRVQVQDKNNVLLNYIDKSTGKLDMTKYGAVIHNILSNEPFFKRFDKNTLEKFLGFGKPEYFNENDIVFTDDRVGIITHGSIRIINHQQSILSPNIEAKYGKGKILGHYSDNGITTNPQSWIITYDSGTEILFFEKAVFNKLWTIQFQRTDRQIIEANIECNPLLRCLSDQSQYQLIYEDMQIRKFKPGELICRMSKRSKLNSLFGKLQEQQATRLMENIGVAKAKEIVDGAQKNENVVSGFVKCFTTQKQQHSIRGLQPHNHPLSGQKDLQDTGQNNHEADDLDLTEQSIEQINTGNIFSDGYTDCQASGSRSGQDSQSYKLHPQYINLVREVLKDKTYKEIDGVYIVYQGHVDILSQKDNQLLHQINIFENFGESFIVKQPSYEYFGDLYAGLNPRNPQEARSVRDLLVSNVIKTRESLQKKHLFKEKQMEQKVNKVRFEEDKVFFEREEAIIQQLKDMENELLTNTDDLVDYEDCTICLFIPYEKFVSLPATEIKRIKEQATLFKLNMPIFNKIADTYDCEIGAGRFYY